MLSNIIVSKIVKIQFNEVRIKHFFQNNRKIYIYKIHCFRLVGTI